MQTKTNSGAVVGGLLLVGLGVILLLDQFVRIDVWHFLWPLFFLGLGAAFFVGMLTGGKQAGGLAIPGTLFMMLGLLFLYQNTFDRWSSWAYAWALLFPTSIGIGLIIFGRWSDKPNLFRLGLTLTTVGLIVFVVLGATVELASALARFGNLDRFLWPLLLIALGVFLLLNRSLSWFISSPPARPGEHDSR